MILWIIPALVLVVAGLWCWGRFLPRSRQWSHDMLIEAPVERVWSVLTDFLRQVEWRTDLRSVETGAGPAGEDLWRERPRRGPANWFRVVRCHRGRLLEVERLPNGFCSGRWTVNLERAAQSTRVTLRGILVIDRPLVRVADRFWQHGGASAHGYSRDLKQHLEAQAGTALSGARSLPATNRGNRK